MALNQPCLTVCWLTQPDKIDAVYGSRCLREGGFLARIMPCLVVVGPTRFNRRQAAVPAGVLADWQALVITLLRTHHQRELPPQLLRPTPEAIELLDDHFNTLVDRRNADLRSVDLFVARWNEWAWRLCVVLHAGTHGAEAGRHEVDVQTTRSAITLADYFAGQQLTLLARVAEAAQRADAGRVLGLLAQHPQRGITARHVQRARITNTAAEAKDLLNGMEASGYLHGGSHRSRRGGHSVLTYHAEPGNGPDAPA